MALNALSQLDCSILWSPISLEGIKLALTFFVWDNHQSKVASETTTWLGVASSTSQPIRLQDSLIVNSSEWNQLIF